MATYDFMSEGVEPEKKGRLRRAAGVGKNILKAPVTPGAVATLAAPTALTALSYVPEYKPDMDASPLRRDSDTPNKFAETTGGAVTGVTRRPVREGVTASPLSNELAKWRGTEFVRDVGRNAADLGSVIPAAAASPEAAAVTKPAVVPAATAAGAAVKDYTNENTYEGQLRRNAGADAYLSAVDRAVGPGGGDMDSINSRIRGLRGDPQAQEMFNAAQGLNRTGITLDETGTLRNDPDAAKRIYRGADGKPTTRWEDTQEYQSGVQRAEDDKQQLATIEAKKKDEQLQADLRATPASLRVEDIIEATNRRKAARAELQAQTTRRGQDLTAENTRALRDVQAADYNRKVKADAAKAGQDAVTNERAAEEHAGKQTDRFREDVNSRALAETNGDKEAAAVIGERRFNDVQKLARAELQAIQQKANPTAADRERVSQLTSKDGSLKDIGQLPTAVRQEYLNRIENLDKARPVVEEGNTATLRGAVTAGLGIAGGYALSRIPGAKAANAAVRSLSKIGGGLLGAGATAAGVHQALSAKGEGTVPSNPADVNPMPEIRGDKLHYKDWAGNVLFSIDKDTRSLVDRFLQSQQDPTALRQNIRP